MATGAPGAAVAPDQDTSELQLNAPTGRAENEDHRQLAVAFDAGPVGIALALPDGALVRVNNALSELLGQPASALLARRLHDLLTPATAAELTAGLAQLTGGHTTRLLVHGHLRRTAGPLVPVLLSCSRVPAAHDSPAYLIVNVHDDTAHQTAHAELIHRCLHDPLTGLPNRVLLLDRLQHALARLARHPASVAVLFIDLDDFKAVNDTHGHSVGDQVLITFARRLQTLQRPGDTVSRYGGDEFLVLCEDSSDSQAHSIAERIHHTLSTPICWVDPHATGITAGSLRLTASVGIATTHDPATTSHEIIHDADSTMYRSKHHP